MRPEDELQANVAKYLDRALPLASWWTATANGAWLGGDKRRRMIQAARLKRTGVKSGAPDLIILHDGRFLGIELKVEGETLTDKQMEAEDQIVIAGGGFAVARSIEQVEQALLHWQVPLRARVTIEGSTEV